MKTRKWNRSVHRKAAAATEDMMREIKPFLPQKVRVNKEKFTDWSLPESCPADEVSEKNSAKLLLSDL
jgi:hypothetical protein